MVLPERFTSKMIVQENGCWLWTACIASNGYGRFGDGGRGRTVAAHRYAYENLTDPVPQGMELDHTCRNRACVNPAHLEPVTHAENMRRARGWSRWTATQCAQGHPLPTDAETRKRTHGGRCRVCHAAAEKARYHERKSHAG